MNKRNGKRFDWIDETGIIDRQTWANMTKDFNRNIFSDWEEKPPKWKDCINTPFNPNIND